MHTGIIGAGLMGHAFIERFTSQGHHICVYNRSAVNTEDLDTRLLEICGSAQELIDECQTVILMLSDADAIDAVLPLSCAASLAGKTILQMATISPSQSRALADKVEALDGRYLEAPVLGSLPEAKSGTLIIMAGGDQDVFDDALPTLRVLSQEPKYIGEVGAGAALKLAMNQLIASLTAGFSLSLGYALKNGVDSGLFMDTVRESALYAKTYDKKLEKYLSRDFGSANFSTRHLLKDIRLFIEDASKAGLDTDALEGIERITDKTVEHGMATMDYSSIYQTINPQDD